MGAAEAVLVHVKVPLASFYIMRTTARFVFDATVRRYSPLNLGGRFSRNAAIPSEPSAVRPMSAIHSVSSSI